MKAALTTTHTTMIVTRSLRRSRVMAGVSRRSDAGSRERPIPAVPRGERGVLRLGWVCAWLEKRIVRRGRSFRADFGALGVILLLVTVAVLSL